MSQDNTHNEQWQTSVKERQKREKESFLEQLRKAPFVSLAAIFDRTGVSKTTYHRWCAEDKEFEKNAIAAAEEGKEKTNDWAKAKLLSLINSNEQLAPLKFWLESHHPEFFSDKKLESLEKQAQIRIIVLHDDDAKPNDTDDDKGQKNKESFE